MSTAKIVAELVEAGHEDLAEKLITAAALSPIAEQIMEHFNKKKLEVVSVILDDPYERYVTLQMKDANTVQEAVRSLPGRIASFEINTPETHEDKIAIGYNLTLESIVTLASSGGSMSFEQSEFALLKHCTPKWMEKFKPRKFSVYLYLTKKDKPGTVLPDRAKSLIKELESSKGSFWWNYDATTDQKSFIEKLIKILKSTPATIK